VKLTFEKLLIESPAHTLLGLEYQDHLNSHKKYRIIYRQIERNIIVMKVIDVIIEK